jgi:predicted dehydrogenase
LGDAKQVYAVSKQFEPVRYRNPQTREGKTDVTVEDTTVAVITFENDVIVQWSDCRVAREKHYNMRALYGSDGCIDWSEGWRHKGETVPMNKLIEQFMSSLNDDEREQLFPAGITHTFALEIKELGDALLHNGAFEVDGMVGLKAEAIPIGIYESSWLGQAISISDIENCEIENYQRDINEGVGLL